MMRSRLVPTVRVCVLAAALASCGGKKEAPKPAPPAAETGKGGETTAAPKPAAAPMQPVIDAFRLGYALGPDGQVRGEGNAFAKSEKVYVSFGIRNTSSGARTKVVWLKQPAGTKLAEESKALPPDPGTVTFTADPASWANGEYAVEIWLVETSGDQPLRRLGSATFTIGARKG
jgi:hypothetical protein